MSGTRILGIVVEQIQKIHVSPHISPTAIPNFRHLPPGKKGTLFQNAQSARALPAS
jgi:hypothetical protein